MKDALLWVIAIAGFMLVIGALTTDLSNALIGGL